MLTVGAVVGELLPAAGCGREKWSRSAWMTEIGISCRLASQWVRKPKVSSIARPGCRVEVLGERICRHLVPCQQRGPRTALRHGHLALLPRPARVERPAPPRSPSRFWRALRPFPLRLGQQLATFPLCYDAGGMSMTATLVVALGVQQRVGVHRQQQTVADRAGVRLRLPPFCRAHVPPAH